MPESRSTERGGGAKAVLAVLGVLLLALLVGAVITGGLFFDAGGADELPGADAQRLPAGGPPEPSGEPVEDGE